MVENARRRNPAFLLYLTLLAVVVGIPLVRWWMRERIDSNEREAALSLKQLFAAESEFHGNDRDGNGINDYWTGDISRLWGHGHLIDLDLAHADSRAINPLTPTPIPRSGYFFVAMETEGSTFPAEEYRQDTDKKSGRVHHLSKFGICAYPADYGVTGTHTLIINEGNTVFKFDTGGKPVLRWPPDSDLPSSFEKME